MINLKEELKRALFYEKWTCNVCGDEVFNDEYFCEKCYKDLPFNDGKICDHCGRALLTDANYCNTCKDFLLSVDTGRSAFTYDGAIPKLIKGFKYDNKKYLGKIFATTLAEIYFKNTFKSDVIVYVPIDAKTYRRRGYNQTEVLAKELSKIIKLPVLDNVLKKVKELNQASKTRAERLKSLDVFKIGDKEGIKGKSVLLIDDVTTTGATAEWIAGLLKKHEASEVILLTVASVKSINY